jgi:outer membrane murein-binding lipoprotein Lpp
VKSVPVWIWYTALRILLFAVPLAVLLLAGVNPWVSAAVAAVFGLSASLIFLRRQRESIASDLYAARHRETPVVRADDEEEDAAVDANTPDAERREE